MRDIRRATGGMTFVYLVAPLLGYASAGLVKLLWRALQTRRLSLRPQGMGGFPSTHACTVGTPLFLIMLRADWSDPALAVAVALAVVVIADSLDLRRRIGEQAAAINRLAAQSGTPLRLRERIGHTPVEAVGGLGLGLLCALALSWLAG